jgi:large subunit ribosomal protein L21
MYAIVEIAGQQFKVEKDKEVFVHRLEGNEGDTVNFENVMLIEDGDAINVGKPFVDGASVSATILSHEKGDKVSVFKKKRRKGYQLENGHRQQFSKLKIEGITVGA